MEDLDKLQALEEVAYSTNHALETVIQLLIDKGYFTQKEYFDKMSEGADDDAEEVGFDANAPRDKEE